MTTSDHFVDFASIDPDTASKLPPGVRFHVSAKTFAQAAAESDNAPEAKAKAVAQLPYRPAITPASA